MCIIKFSTPKIGSFLLFFITCNLLEYLMIYTKHVANSLNVIKVYFNEVTYCSTNYRDTSTIIMKYKLQQNYKGMIWQRPNEFNTIFRSIRTIIILWSSEVLEITVQISPPIQNQFHIGRFCNELDENDAVQSYRNLIWCYHLLSYILSAQSRSAW